MFWMEYARKTNPSHELEQHSNSIGNDRGNRPSAVKQEHRPRLHRALLSYSEGVNVFQLRGFLQWTHSNCSWTESVCETPLAVKYVISALHANARGQKTGVCHRAVVPIQACNHPLRPRREILLLSPSGVQICRHHPSSDEPFNQRLGATQHWSICCWVRRTHQGTLTFQQHT